MDKRDYEAFTITKEAREDGYVACDSCDHEFAVGDEALMSNRDHIFCSPRCIAEDEQRQAEAAHERYLDRYYGGEVVTQEEQYRKAWEDKRKM